MTHNLQEFVPPFSLYLNIENAQNPARKHFEKTNVMNMHLMSQSFLIFLSRA